MSDVASGLRKLFGGFLFGVFIPFTLFSQTVPQTNTEVMVKRFLDVWGGDIKKLRAAKTAAQFEAIVRSLRLTDNEIRRTNLFIGKPNADIWRKLIVALQRTEVSPGALLAVGSYFETLSKNRTQSLSTVTGLVKSMDNDPVGTDRMYLLDLVGRVPGIATYIRNYLLTSLYATDNAVAAGKMIDGAKPAYRAALHLMYLKTVPYLGDAQTLTNTLVAKAKTNLEKSGFKNQLASVSGKLPLAPSTTPTPTPGMQVMQR